MAENLYDDLLEHYMEEMKPHLLRLAASEDRIRSAMWIRKLCETPTVGMENRRLRNMYAQLLTEVSKSGILDGIFAENPPPGELKPLPPNLAKQFDVVGIFKVQDLMRPQSLSPSHVSDLLQERMTANTSLSLPLHDLPMQSNSFPGLKSPSNLYRKDFHSSAMSLPLLSIKTTEDLIYLDLKNHYESKIKDQELKIISLENRVRALIKQSSMVRENKDKQVMELKVLATHSNRIAEDHFDTKFNDTLAKLEQEKLEFQCKHFSQIENLQEASRKQISELESQMQENKTSMMKIIAGLEKQVKEMQSEIQRLMEIQSQLEKDKEELEQRANVTSLELLSSQRRCESLNEEYKEAEKEHQIALINLRNKTDEQIDFVVKKQAGLVAHANDTIRDLHQQVAELNQIVANHEQKYQDLKEAHSTEVKKLKENVNKGRQNFKDKLNAVTKDAEEKIQWLEISLRERQEEIGKLQNIMEQQSAEASIMLEDFKNKLETNSALVYEDLQKQMETIASDLMVSKMARERQAQKFVIQLEEERKRHAQEISTLKEKCKAEQQLEKEQLMKTNSEELKHAQESFKQYEKVIEDKEVEILKLKDKITETKKLGDQKFQEFRLLFMEEKMKIKHQIENETRHLLQGIEEKIKANILKQIQKIKELEIKVTFMTEQIHRLKERNINLQQENENRHQHELSGIQEQHFMEMKMLHEELTRERQRTVHLENEIIKEAEDGQEKIKELLSEFEKRNQGLLPRVTQTEFETTIGALKSQISCLQHRIRLFEEDQGRKDK